MNRRLVGLAVAFVVAGLAASATPSLAPAALAALGRAGTATLALGLGGLTLVGSVALARRSPVGPPLEPPGSGPSISAVGADVDETLARVADPDVRADREAVRERLREATHRALVRRGATPDEARERLQRGTWTDDPVAAEFLGGRRLGRRQRLREALSTRPPFVRRAARAAHELDRLEASERR